MKILIYCWLVALTVPMLAQTAKVVALTPNETARAKQLKMDQENLTKETQEFELMIKHEYLMTGPIKLPKNTILNYDCSVDACSGSNWKPGWGNNGEFEYSEDYRFIVPKPAAPSNICTSCNVPYWNNGGGFFTAPSTGSVVPLTGGISW